MRDPRLLEIDFLMDLDRSGMLAVRSTHVVETSGAGPQRTTYGETPATFRDLLLELILEGRVGGSAAQTNGGSGIDPAVLAAERISLMHRLTAGQPIDLRITHAGRVRLWDLRDALLRDPDLEPFGLRSKAAWERDLPVRLRWASEYEPLSIVFVDLDAFGRVNKELGHSVGDEVLRATFNLTKSVVGSRGQVYRWGGEEIGALLPTIGLEHARTMAEELRLVIEVEVHKAVPALGRAQTASIGVGAFEQHVEPRVAFDYVEGLEKEAKSTGKNKVVARQYSNSP